MAVQPAMGASAPRIMIVGDSMTQGAEGDFTWRYRLFEWLREQEYNCTFTGPYKGTQEPEESHPPRPPPLSNHQDPDVPVRSHGGYAKSVSQDFDSHHFAVWGRQCAVAKDQIEATVRHHSPDLLLVMLGFNDIGWFVSDAKGTLKSMKQFVANARSANPRLQLVLANIPQRTKMDGREDLPKSTDEYNDLLDRVVPQWSQHDSPVYIADVCKEYTAEDATYDGLHPNALGDYQIARAFSLSMWQDLKIGRSPLAIPPSIPTRELPMPQDFQLVSSPVGVTALWEQVYGAYGYEFRSRVNDDDWTEDTRGMNRWDSHWASDGSQYQAQVRARYGAHTSDWTTLQTAVARPELAEAPTDVTLQNTKQGVIASWTLPQECNGRANLQYSLLWRDTDGSMFFPGLAAFKSPPAHLKKLEDGHVYDICMLTWNTAGEGRPSDWRRIVIRSASVV